MFITLIIFFIAGLSHESSSTVHIAEFTQALGDKFDISLWLMIVPVATAILIAKKIPSIITLFLSTAMAIVFAVIFQPDLLREIAGEGEGVLQLIQGGMINLFGGTSLYAGNA